MCQRGQEGRKSGTPGRRGASTFFIVSGFAMVITAGANRNGVRLVQSGLRVPISVAVGLILFGSAITLFPPDVPLLGLQYACLVGGVVLVESRIKGKIPAAILFGGNASYALYLVHPLVVPTVAVILTKAQQLPSQITVSLIVILSLVAGAIAHLMFERPVTSYLKNLVKRPHLAHG
jgi:exopolysaccharide production protein ExoZ